MIACNSTSTSFTLNSASNVITHQEEHNENIEEHAPFCLPARFSISQVGDRITGKAAQDVVRKRSLIKMWG